MPLIFALAAKKFRGKCSAYFSNSHPSWLINQFVFLSLGGGEMEGGGIKLFYFIL